MIIKANLTKVKVYPKDLKAIPDILPFNKLIQGDPVEMELSKKEIRRCMNFGDVYDLTSGEEVLIDTISFKEIKEFVEDEEASEEDEESETETEEPTTDETPVEEETTTEEPVEEEVIPEEETPVEEETNTEEEPVEETPSEEDELL